MAALKHSTVFQPRTITLGLSAFDRKAIERQIEELIALLDQVDGDVDLEDDELHEDPLDLGEAPNVHGMMPRYGADQSVGPNNYRQAEHEVRLAMFA
jgi:hypothetical protein